MNLKDCDNTILIMQYLMSKGALNALRFLCDRPYITPEIKLELDKEHDDLLAETEKVLAEIKLRKIASPLVPLSPSQMH